MEVIYMNIGDILESKDDSRIRSYVLERIDFHAQHEIPFHKLKNKDLEFHVDNLSLSLVARLSSYIYGRESQKIIVYPKTWFQHLKETIYSNFRFMEKLFAEKFPVDYTEKVVTAQMLFPDIKSDSNDKYVRVYAIKSDS